MKILSFDKKRAKIRITSPEDLWYLSQIIEQGDSISGKTLRKVTIGSEEEKTVHVMRPVFLKIETEKIELTPTAIRISGKIIDCPNDITKASYHTFNVEQDSEIIIEKEEWLSFYKKQLDDAATASHIPVIVCVFDRDEAIIAISKPYGYETLMKLKGDPEKKEKRALIKATLYQDIIKALQNYNLRYKPKHIILASPAFYKEDLLEGIKDKDLKKMIIAATCSSAHENALDEVLKRPETKSALQNVRIAQETEKIEKLLAAISKDGLVVYGKKETMKAADASAVEELLITDACIRDYKEKARFKEVNDLFRQVERSKGGIFVMSTENDAGKKLQGLGGIAAMLRYKLEW